MTDLERAQSPMTGADALRALASRGGELARAVAGNPAAPGDLLVSLALDWADVVVNNPSLPKGITDEATLMALLVPRDCPEQVFWDCIASLQPDLAWRMAGHALTSELMVALVDTWRELTGGDELWDSGVGVGVVEALASQRALPPSLARQFLADAVARRVMAENPHCARDVLEALAKDRDPFTRDLAQQTLDGLG